MAAPMVKRRVGGEILTRINQNALIIAWSIEVISERPSQLSAEASRLKWQPISEQCHQRTSQLTEDEENQVEAVKEQRSKGGTVS